MDNDVLLTRGRYQPFGNHHAAVFDHFMDKHDADELNVVVEGLSGERLPDAPFYGSEVADMIERSFDQDYDFDYEVNAINQADILDDEVFSLLEDRPVYFTREKSHANAFNSMKWVYDRAFWSDRGIQAVDYEPREDTTPFESFDRPVEESSTNIRNMIDSGDEEWRRYVSESVEDFVDETDDAREAIGREQNGGKYSSILRNAFF